MAFDEADHRLFVSTRKPESLIVLDSDSGKVVTSLPCVHMIDDMAYDPKISEFTLRAASLSMCFDKKMLTTTS